MALDFVKLVCEHGKPYREACPDCALKYAEQVKAMSERRAAMWDQMTRLYARLAKTCPDCKGSGHIELFTSRETCTRCSGRGSV